MNAEVTFENDDGRKFTFSVTQEGTVYEVCERGWRRVRSEPLRALILEKLVEGDGFIDA